MVTKTVTVRVSKFVMYGNPYGLSEEFNRQLSEAGIPRSQQADFVGKGEIRTWDELDKAEKVFTIKGSYQEVPTKTDLPDTSRHRPTSN